MPVMTAVALELSDEERAALEKMARSSSLPHRVVRQAQALLWAGEGVANEEIARRSGVDADAVRRWRRRFGESGVDGVGRIAKGRGRRSWLPDGTVAAVMKATLEEAPPDGSTHWSTRTMAEHFGIGKDTVQRIWANHEVKPWRVTSFKLSSDPRFEEKLVDVVGL
jgi:transposase-like protein